MLSYQEIGAAAMLSRAARDRVTVHRGLAARITQRVPARSRKAARPRASASSSRSQPIDRAGLLTERHSARTGTKVQLDGALYFARRSKEDRHAATPLPHARSARLARAARWRLCEHPEGRATGYVLVGELASASPARLARFNVLLADLADQLRPGLVHIRVRRANENREGQDTPGEPRRTSGSAS